MATRVRTKDFIALREQCKLKKTRGGFGTNMDSVDLSDEVDPASVRVAIGFSHSFPPEWVNVVEQLQRDIQTTKDKMRTLQKLHSNRLKVKFNEDELSEKEQEIEIQSAEISRLLHQCEGNLKRVATIGNVRGATLSQNERLCRLNVMRGLGTELQGLSKQFRHAQQDFLSRLRGQEESGKDRTFDPDSASPSSSSSASLDEKGLSHAQLLELEEMGERATEREREILKIAKSVEELAVMFRELSVLVIEQGSVLDRIDYNVEQALVKVKAGTIEIKKADDYSKKARTMKCILFLLFVIIVLILVLIIKHTSFTAPNLAPAASPTKPP